MWLITTRGMFSAVQHNTDADLIVVRTRVYGDADHLAQLLNQVGPYRSLERATGPAEVISYDYSDYPFRVIVTRTEWTWFAQLCAKELDYGNFKSAVAAKQGAAREAVYHRVWEALLGLTRLPGAKGTAKQRAESLREAPRRAFPLLRRSTDGRDAVTAALPLDDGAWGPKDDAARDAANPLVDDEYVAPTGSPTDDDLTEVWDAWYETDRACVDCKHTHAGDCDADCDTCIVPTLFTDRDIARQEADR